VTGGLSLREIARALGGEVRNDEILCPGPRHSPSDRSLAIKVDSKAPDGILVHSFSGDDPIECRDYVRVKLGLPSFTFRKAQADWGEELARYAYRLADGTPYLLVRKFVDANGRKQFPQSHWEGSSWIKGKPNGHKIPYRLPELIAAPPSATIFIAEGEKDCDALARLSFVATCNSEGAGKWTADLNAHFRDRSVVILPDNDAPGRSHAEHVARNLDRIAASVRIVELPDLPPKGDVSDWLRTDPSGARLVKECDRASLWEPGRKDKDKIAELAELDKLDYGRARKETATALGVTATELDKIVAEARRSKPGKEPERWLVEPWDEPVATGGLLASLVEIYARHVVLPPHGANAMALWALHAWAIDAAFVTPFLMFVSPEPRCGKSTALALLYRTAPRTAMASNISAAAVYRYIEALHPTLLLDEAETFLKDNEDIRGILNSGHSRDTAHVIRLVGDDYEPKEFSTWGPKALASIGKLAATLRDRALIIPMKRRKAGERVKKLRIEETDEFATLRRKAQRWASDNTETLKGKRPKLPQGLNDRAEDNWEPLLAIAELAGGEWPALAHKAALSLTQDLDEGSIRTKLLDDIRKVFSVDGEDRASSAELAAKLVEFAEADEDAGPWLTFGKNGKPITQRHIAKLLSEFSIFPRTIRIDQRPMAKGYLREQFEDAFERYLSPVSGHPPVLSVTPLQISDLNDLGPKRSVTPGLFVTDENAHNVLNDKHCDAVTDKTPPRPETGVCAQCRAPSDGTEQFCAIGDETVWLHSECQRFYVKRGKTV
jgi:putative DNA primase/helicase